MTCACHGSQFDVTSGAVLRGPAQRPVRSRRCRSTATTCLPRREEDAPSMKIFLDTAGIDEIRTAARWGVLDGVTTNPSLFAKVGGELRRRPQGDLPDHARAR